MEHLLIRLSYYIFLLLTQVNAKVPAIYVFGDSLADVGNNDYLDFSLLKANFPHNGVDYPGGKATGRFSNGKNSVDFLAEMLGLRSPPAYLSISANYNVTQVLLDGINFASGGAGVLDSTRSGQCLKLSKQIDYYSTLLGQSGNTQVQYHISRSIFILVVGSNDILDYVNNQSKITQQQLVDSMISLLRGHLKRMHTLGARKYVILGTGPIGCCPQQRKNSSSGECNEKANSISIQYNYWVGSLLQEIKSELGDMDYSFFNSSIKFQEYIERPSAQGFTEVRAACCGLGDLNAVIACTPISRLCQNRTSYLFWDLYHPTEAAARLLTEAFFGGSPPYVFPINVEQLSAL